MDPFMIMALVLFLGMVVAWFVLPAMTTTGVADVEADAVGLLATKPQA